MAEMDWEWHTEKHTDRQEKRERERDSERERERDRNKKREVEREDKNASHENCSGWSAKQGRSKELQVGGDTI